MSHPTKTWKGVTQASLRRLRNTPTYFFLIWRWSTWLYALAVILAKHAPLNLALLPLGVTFIQALVVTLYAPVFQIFIPGLPGLKKLHAPGQRKQQVNRLERRAIWGRRRPQPLAEDDEGEILNPISRTSSPNWDIAIYGLDVVICGLVTYYSGIFGDPPFGIGSPFYRYGLSTVLVAAFTYRYRGGLAAALGYELIILFGAFVPPPLPHHPLMLNMQDFLGSLIDAPLVALLAAYLATLLNSYIRSKRRDQDTVRRQLALLRVGETLVVGASNRQKLLRQSAKQIRIGGHFQRLIVAIIDQGGDSKNPQPEIDTYVESDVVESLSPDKSESLVEQVAQSGKKLSTFEQEDSYNGEGQEGVDGIARLYMPFFKDAQVHLVLGAESIRSMPFDSRQENFLTIAGGQLFIALENMRLTEQTAELAAIAERGRIAREIHDGIAQLIYMMSLNTETCAALVQRMADTSAEETQTLAPIIERLDKLVTISKQALWETRHYMFTLKPLISGTSTLTQMLTNQLHEFEAISGLPVRLEVGGVEETPNGDQRRAHKTAQVGTAIFRITQEALTNAYKHADATQISVCLRHQPHKVEIEINDDGRNKIAIPHSYDLGAEEERERIYGGHGMRGMRERAEELGGTFEVIQKETGGTSIRACIPI